MNSGHYTSIIFDEKMAHHLNDEKVGILSHEHALKEMEKDAYILLFEKKVRLINFELTI